MKLILPVNKYFFNKVKNNDLVEDYREIKKYWINKIIKKNYRKLSPQEIVNIYFDGNKDIFVNFEKIIFKNGYNEDSPTIKCFFKGIRLTTPEEMTCMGRGIAFAIKIEYL